MLVAAGYRLVIANTKEDFAREAVHLQGAGNGTIDGLLLASTAGQWEQVAPLLPAGLPTVLVDRVFEHTGSSVSVDSAAALGQAVKALAAQGHARIGFFRALRGFLPPKSALPPTGRPWQPAACRWKTALFKRAIPCAEAARSAAKSCWRWAALPSSSLTA